MIPLQTDIGSRIMIYRQALLSETLSDPDCCEGTPLFDVE